MLDEAHLVRNPESKKFKACNALEASHHWALTGTPLVNRAADLYSLFKIIKQPDTTTYENFKQICCVSGNNEPEAKLTENLAACMMRRTHVSTVHALVHCSPRHYYLHVHKVLDMRSCCAGLLAFSISVLWSLSLDLALALQGSQSCICLKALTSFHVVLGCRHLPTPCFGVSSWYLAPNTTILHFISVMLMYPSRLLGSSHFQCPCLAVFLDLASHPAFHPSMLVY